MQTIEFDGCSNKSFRHCPDPDGRGWVGLAAEWTPRYSDSVVKNIDTVWTCVMLGYENEKITQIHTRLSLK